MSSDPTSQGAPGGPEEEELRRAYEEQLSRITIPDMMVQAAVTLLNLAARELPQGPEGAPAQPAGDMEQVRDAIDGAGALLAILERRMAREVRPLRDALAQLQMAYAAAVRSGPAAAPEQPAAAGAGDAAGTGGQAPPVPGGEGAGEAPGQKPGDHGPGPAESSGRSAPRHDRLGARLLRMRAHP